MFGLSFKIEIPYFVMSLNLNLLEKLIWMKCAHFLVFQLIFKVKYVKCVICADFS